MGPKCLKFFVSKIFQVWYSLLALRILENSRLLIVVNQLEKTPRIHCLSLSRDLFNENIPGAYLTVVIIDEY